MNINEIMSSDIQCVGPDATVEEAAQLMLANDIGTVLVCEDNLLLGIVTDRDIVLRSVADGSHPSRTAVSDIMSSRLYFCYEEEDVEEAAARMKNKQVRRLPVLDGERHLTGIVSLGDIANGAHDRKLIGETLEGVPKQTG